LPISQLLFPASLRWSGYRHPPDPSTSRVQINPPAPISAPGWIPADLQSESRGPYFDSRSQFARPCATCRFLGHGNSFASHQGGPEKKNSQRVRKMFAAMLCIEPHGICDITKSHEAITCRVPASSSQPTSNSTVSMTIALGIAPSRHNDSLSPLPRQWKYSNDHCKILSDLLLSILVNHGLDSLKILQGDCPALFCSISNSLRSRLFLWVEHELRHSFCYSRIDDNFI
jgi:hypothetical protein